MVWREPADDASMTQEGTVVGTPQYMSPEQTRGQSVDQRSDLFSLGSVLYALATGRPPFRAESTYGVMRKITDESPTPIRELNPDIPTWLCLIIERLMEKEKEARFQSVAEVHRLLEACLSHIQQPTISRLPEIPNPRRERLSWISKLVAGVIAMVALTIGLLFVLGVPSTPRQEQPTKQASKPAPYEKEYVVTFPGPNEIGTLNVDIKRGSIDVTGYDGDKVIVALSVPNYASSTNRLANGLRELRPNTLDFDIETSNEQIKVDGNSYDYITNVTIKVPTKTHLILDSYRDGTIQVTNVRGNFNVRSHNNDIRLKKVTGAGRVWSYNGDLAADFENVTNDQPLHLETYNGSIDLRLPAQIKADVKYRSGTGRVLTDFDIALSTDSPVAVSDDKIGFDEFVSGTLNGGGPSLTLDCEKGDIHLLRRMSESLR